MIIGVISDTHDDTDALVKGVEELVRLGASVLIHCGDWISLDMVKKFDELVEKYCKRGYAVLGNNDSEIKTAFTKSKKLSKEIIFPEDEILTLNIDDKKIAIYHGENRSMLKKLFSSEYYDVIFCGHSHVPKTQNGGKTLLINPGSASQKIANSKHIPCSVAIYDSIQNEADLIYLT